MGRNRILWNAVRFFGPLLFLALALGVLLWSFPTAASPRVPSPAYRLCTELDFFQLTQGIKLGVGPDARRRKLPSCVDMDEEFWKKVRADDVFPVRGVAGEHERDVTELIFFLGAVVKDLPTVAGLRTAVAPGGDRLISIVRKPAEMR